MWGECAVEVDVSGQIQKRLSEYQSRSKGDVDSERQRQVHEIASALPYDVG